MNIAYKLKPALFLFSLLVLLLNPTVLSKPFPDSLTVEKILFANNPASGNLDLYIMNNDGSGTKRIVISLGKECGPSLSPDKKKIAFYRHIDENNWHEFIMNFNGTGIVQLTNGQNTWDGKPAWSPDGSRIIFGRVYPLDNFRSEIWVMNADGSGLHRIGANYATSPSYSPDGLKIVYSGFVIDKFQICTADSNGGTVQVLTTAGTENSEPVYSPDGSKIAFQSNRDGNPEIYIMNADGTNQTRLTNNTDTDADVCFSPDGGYLAYTSMRDGKYDIYTMQINGSNQVKLTTLAGSNIQPQWTNIRVPFPAYLGQAKPDTIPKRFGGSDMVSDGLWWWHGAPIFSPDGSEMFMVKYISTKPSGCMQLYYTKIVHGEWSALQQPGFTSDSCDNSPVYSRDGNTLFFISNRTGIMRLYKVMRMASGWSNPVEVEINRQQLQGGLGWGFSLTADQSMYFALFPQQGGYKIAKAKMLNGIYSVFEEFPATVNTSAAQGTPYIEPYEKYVVFESIRSAGLGYHDLYVSFKDANGSWTQSQNLGNKINGQYEDAMPYVSPDGKYLFFNSAKTGDLGYNAYWVSTKVFDKFNPLLSVKTDKKAVPGMFILEQNFPNPFNPSTTIHCRIGQATRAALKVYDVLGREVKSIFSGDIQAGDYSFKWDGTDNANNNVSGGVYFYRFSGEKFSQVRKAIFVK